MNDSAHRHEDFSDGSFEMRQIVTYEVELSTATGLANVRESFEKDLTPERQQWIRTYAGILTSIRFCVFVAPDIATRTLIAIAHRISTPDGEWNLVDEPIDHPDISLMVVIGEDRPGRIKDLRFSVKAPEGEDSLYRIDAVLLLREWLCSRPGGPIPGVPRFGFNLVADLAMRSMIVPSEAETQMYAPLKCMSVIEREGFVYPYFATDEVDGIDEFGDERWDEIEFGPGL